MDLSELSAREKMILRYVIHQFILTANPVGSRNVSKQYDIGLSPATIRNIMSDLEDSGFLDHPHTSAGRIPTDKGYRFYVDSLMDPPFLDTTEKKFINKSLNFSLPETDDILQITSKILSDITNQIACVTYPRFENAVLERIQIVQISSSRLLIVLSVKSGLIKTITLEIDAEIKADSIQIIECILNERLSGLKFSEIRLTFKDRIKDIDNQSVKPVIKVFIESIDKIFSDIKQSEKSIIAGTSKILKHPEFEHHENIQSVVELIENKNIIIHIMDKTAEPDAGGVSISIGKENEEEKMTEFSMVTKNYKFGQVSGTLGIVGPKRMDYSKIVAVVDYIAEVLSTEFKIK